MNFELLKKLDNEYVANTYARFDLDIHRGHGATCYDMAGKEYVDFTSGIGVNSLGFCDLGWISAVTEQLMKVQHISNLYYTKPGALLAQELCCRTSMKNVFFANSGAEANEGAIKAARKYSSDKYGAGRSEIITLKNSFHGRTLATLSATGQEVFHRHFDPFVEGFRYAKPNDIASMKELISSKTCAVMLELIQGEGGVVPLDEEYVKQVAELCYEHDILLIIDEVQTGIGRTGTLFLYEQYGIRPDIVTSAKGLGGGLPLGAILFGEKTQKTLSFGDHATTFGANPAICAGALEILKRLDDDFLKEVFQKGEKITQEALKLPFVKSVTGKGLMLGLELTGITAKELAVRGIEQGVIILTAKDKARLLPPLNITYEEIDKGISALSKAFHREEIK